MEQPTRGKVVTLMDALRKSIGDAGTEVAPKKKPVASTKAEPKKGIDLVKTPAKEALRKKSA